MNRFSLYLEYYPPVLDVKSGKRVAKEYLGLYIYQQDFSPLHAEHNRNVFAQAESIREQRSFSIKTNDGFLFGIKAEAKVDILNLFYLASMKHDYRWLVTYKHFSKFLDGIPCYKEDLNPDLIEQFRKYLNKAKQLKYDYKKLSASTAISYFTIFIKFINSIKYDSI